ncbi:MAG: polysulfide reductase NrfD [candidate division Zixibacteria bacterium]|nr:polysulfide reductase NrfD [candidate division Zixibacteria bacterium]
MDTVPSTVVSAGNAFYDPVLKPIAQPRGRSFYIIVTLLGLCALSGTLAWFYQLRYGLKTTGMNAPVFWGIYLVNFIFFTGISMAGTMISAVLRIAHAEWRRPITRLAEAVTVIALSIVFDEGRPDRLLNVVFYGSIQSPIFWDIVCVATYLTLSGVYLYLPLIPDLAILRDRGIGRAGLYRLLALGYTGTEKQRKRLETAISILAVLIIPVAVSVHSVVSYIFATTLQPGWHSTVFGPYFVVGALFSGLAALLIVMAILRRAFHLEGILKDIHFNNVALVLLAMDFLVIYFTLNIHLIEITGQEPAVLAPVLDVVTGRFSVMFWSIVIGGFIVPAIILLFPKGRTVTGCVIASSLIVVGMWYERFLIVIPTLLHPRMP